MHQGMMSNAQSCLDIGRPSFLEIWGVTERQARAWVIVKRETSENSAPDRAIVDKQAWVASVGVSERRYFSYRNLRIKSYTPFSLSIGGSDKLMDQFPDLLLVLFFRFGNPIGDLIVGASFGSGGRLSFGLFQSESASEKFCMSGVRFVGEPFRSDP